jgi:hypothetical protein
MHSRFFRRAAISACNCLLKVWYCLVRVVTKSTSLFVAVSSFCFEAGGSTPAFPTGFTSVPDPGDLLFLVLLNMSRLLLKFERMVFLVYLLFRFGLFVGLGSGGVNQ